MKPASSADPHAHNTHPGRLELAIVYPQRHHQTLDVCQHLDTRSPCHLALNLSLAVTVTIITVIVIITVTVTLTLTLTLSVTRSLTVRLTATYTGRKSRRMRPLQEIVAVVAIVCRRSNDSVLSWFVDSRL